MLENEGSLLPWTHVPLFVKGVIARCNRPFRHSKGAINYIDTDHQTLQTLSIVWLLISLNVISISDQTVCLPYLNTTQISVKSEGKCLKVSLANFCSELLIIYWDWKYHLPVRTSMTKNRRARSRILLVNTSWRVGFLRPDRGSSNNIDTQANTVHQFSS